MAGVFGLSGAGWPDREDRRWSGVEKVMVNWSEQAISLRHRLGRVGLWVPGFAARNPSQAAEIAGRAEVLGAGAL
jgi:hypothetical protein